MRYQHIIYTDYNGEKIELHYWKKNYEIDELLVNKLEYVSEGIFKFNIESIKNIISELWPKDESLYEEFINCYESVEEIQLFYKVKKLIESGNEVYYTNI